MRSLRLGVLLALGCARTVPSADICREFKIGACAGAPVVAGYKLVGCVAYRPEWKTVRCTFLKNDETAVITLGSDNCGPWSLIVAQERK